MEEGKLQQASQQDHSGDILVVDDSMTSRTLLGGILKKRGYHVRLAQDGEEALAIARDSPPDLILLDLLMPRLDGFKVTRRLRRDPDLPYIPIILITAIGDIDSKVRGLEAGADDFVVKPPDEGELVARVGALLRLKRSQEALLAETCKTELLYRVSRELSAELDLDTLLSRVLDLTIESTDASGGSIILLDEGGNDLHYISARQGQVATVSETAWKKIVQDGLAGWVIQYRQAVIVPDTEQDPRWINIEESPLKRSALVVPLIHAGQVAGALTLTHEEPGRFDTDHLDLLSGIASQAAVVIEKARAYQKEQFRARQLQLVNEVSRQVTSILDPNQLLKEVTRLICQTFNYYYVEVALLEGQSLIFQDWGCGRREHLSSTPTQQSLSDESIVSRAVRQGQPLLVPDVRQEPHYRPTAKLPDTITELAAPMKVAGETLGVLVVRSDRPAQLTAEQIPLLETLASQVAVALRNAQLFAETQQRLQEQEALLAVNASVSSTLELETVLRRVLGALIKAMNVTACAISAWDRETDTIITLMAEHTFGRFKERWAGEMGTTFSLKDYPATAKVVHTGKPLIVNLSDPLADPEEKSLLEKYDLANLLMLPLRARDRVVGLVELYDKEERAYSAQEIAFYQALANHAGLAIENARLYTETEGERGKLAAILTSTADVVIVTEDEGRVLLVNPAAERAFGVQVESVVGQPLAEAIPHPALAELFQRRVKGTPPFVAEIPLAEEHILYASISPVQGVGYVAVMQDITHLKMLDRMKSEFVSTVSHDLRSPLSAIRGYADLLLETVKGQNQEFAQRIKLGAKHMTELIEDLLNLGKIEAGLEAFREPCRLEELVMESLYSASFQAELREVTLTFSPPASLRPVLGDPRQLRQVLDNLIGNALKYTPAGGEIVIRACEEADRVTVEVQDNGIGIPRDSLPRLFEKFYRVPSPEMTKIPGSGLGLAIVKAIVEQHEGQIWVESELGQGSTFGFSVPIDQAPAPDS